VLGERLAEVRKDHGDTQQALADRLNVTKFTISNWEQEKSEPSHELLVKICKFYDVSSDYLLGITDLDPAYTQRRRKEQFSTEELEILRRVERYLLWCRQGSEKTNNRIVRE